MNQVKLDAINEIIEEVGIYEASVDGDGVGYVLIELKHDAALKLYHVGICHSDQSNALSDCKKYLDLSSLPFEWTCWTGSSFINKQPYFLWVPIIERMSNCKVMDDDGGRRVCKEGLEYADITFDEANKYFAMCTVMWNKGKEKGV